MAKLNLAGRTDVNDYFEQSGTFESEQLAHTPFLVFLVEGDTVTVRIVDKPSKLLALPDDTSVMSQWRGAWRSDFFQFSVGQYRRHIESRDRMFRSAKNVVKVIGSRGGFRSLSYEYTDAAGVTVHITTSARQEAERLEQFFKRNSIPINIVRSPYK